MRETAGHAAHEAISHQGEESGSLTGREVFALASWRHRSLATVSRAGLVNNLNEGMAWGLFPVFFALEGLELGAIGLLVALAPGVWGVGQLFTGALSDRVGRKPLIAMGQRKVAERIKRIARESGVPTMENKPLARALLANARVGMTIPSDLYVAVAEILAFVFSQRRPARRESGAA